MAGSGRKTRCRLFDLEWVKSIKGRNGRQDWKVLGTTQLTAWEAGREAGVKVPEGVNGLRLICLDQAIVQEFVFQEVVACETFPALALPRLPGNVLQIAMTDGLQLFGVWFHRYPGPQ